MTATVSAGGILLDDAALDLLFRHARSSTEFTDEPVTDEQLRTIYELTKYAPTSFNQQPLRIVAVRSEEARAELLPHLSGRNRARSQNCPLVLLLAADIDFHENLPILFPFGAHLRDKLHDEQADRIEQARYNTILQIGFLIVAIRCLGLAAGPILGFDHEAVDSAFFPDGRWQSVLVMNVGRGLPKRYDRLPRLPFEDAVRVV